MANEIQKKSGQNSAGLYNLSRAECLPLEEGAAPISQPETIFVDASTQTKASQALALNIYQQENQSATQLTFEALKQEQMASTTIHGLAIKETLAANKQKIGQLKKDVSELEKNLGAQAGAAAVAGMSLPSFNLYADSAMEESQTKIREVRALESQNEALEKSLLVAADLIVNNILQHQTAPYPFIIEARIGASLATLGLGNKAREHFDQASKQAQAYGMQLEAVDLRFQGILAQEATEESWQNKGKELEAFLLTADREAQMRLNSPEGMRYVLERQGDTNSWTVLRAEALSALIENYVEHGSPSDAFKVRQYIKAITSRLEELAQGEESPSEEETLALLEALSNAQRWHMAEGYHLGAEAKMEELNKLGQEVAQEYEKALALYPRFEKKEKIGEALGELEGTTYFHFWQKAGLPTKGVYTFLNHIRTSPPSQSAEALQKIIREKAPHFFGTKGELLTQEALPFPKDADQAAFVEGSLHYDNASFSEHLLMEGGGGILGATAGAKLGAAGGSFFGPEGAPIGALLGGGAGVFGGQEILDQLHAKERAVFVNDAKKAGMPLARLSLDEAHENENTNFNWKAASILIGSVTGGNGAKSGSKLLRGLGWLGQGVTWRYLGRQVLSEAKYTLRWARVLGQVTGVAKILQKIGTPNLPTLLQRFGVADASSILKTNAVSFEEVWATLPPWEQARGKDVLEGLWKQMISKKAAAKEAAATMPRSTALIDRFLTPANQLWDASFGKFGQYGSTRLQALRQVIINTDPQFAANAETLRLRKELLREVFLASQPATHEVTSGSSTIARAMDRSAAWLRRNVGTADVVRAHRWGLPLVAADMFYDGNGDKGGGWVLWDGEIDSPLGYLGYIASSNYASSLLFNNSVFGADIASAIGGYVTTKGQMIMGQAEGNETDWRRLTGTQNMYLATTPLASLFTSGLHYLGNFPAGQALGATPGVRLLPSMSSFTSAFRASSTIGKPNFLTVPGMALILGYQSAGIGYGVSELFSGKNQINADPYLKFQRGIKYAVPLPFINAIQMWLGYQTTAGQLTGRTLGIPVDLALSKLCPPFLNKGLFEPKMHRLLNENNPASLESAWNVYSSANTTLDILGVIGRMIDTDDPLDTSLWHSNTGRIGHWRWERRGIETWTSPTPIQSLVDKRGITHKGWIEELADAGDQKTIDNMLRMYELHFLQPKAPWRTSSNLKDQRGVMIFSFIIKYFADKFQNGDYRFIAFQTLISSPKLKAFFQALPTPQTHEELLDFVTQVDEGSFLNFLQKAPAPVQDFSAELR